MRVNIYAEEMTKRVEIIRKTTPDGEFTGLRLYLELPASYIPVGGQPMRKATPVDTTQAIHYSAPFIHHPGDDDSAAVTFWGKRDLRDVLRVMLAKLDEHYAQGSGHQFSENKFS